MKNADVIFSEDAIQRLFGHEAAEDEEIERLREYYFKSDTYDQVVTDLPLRILVGHKGIGKSALFQVSMKEDEEQGHLVVLIKPDDIVGLGENSSDFLSTIREWKEGISEIIVKKVLKSFGADDTKIKAAFKKFGGVTLDVLRGTLKDDNFLSFEPAKKLIIEKFLSSSKVRVYIDDLDRGWQGRIEDIHRISALINAVRDITTESRGIQFKMSLRSDVYFLVRTSDESTDKIEGSVIWHSWTNHEIFMLLVKRIETFFGNTIDEKKLKRMSQQNLAYYLEYVFEDRFNGVGHWKNAPIHRVLMSLIRKRPRDLIKLCTLAARRAYSRGSSLIVTKDLEQSFEEYSQGRLQDTINEFRSEMPDIERLLFGMRPSKKEKTTKEGYVYSTDSLLKKLKNITEQGDFKTKTGKIYSEKNLASFLYKINFITARKEAEDGIIRKYFEENRYLSSEFVEFGFNWEIHPAYRWALQPESIKDIYRNMELSKE